MELFDVDTRDDLEQLQTRCCALRQCKFAALTLSSRRFCLCVPSGVLGMRPSWVFCCAPWPDPISQLGVLLLSCPMMGIHCIQPIAFVNRVPPIWFDAISPVRSFRSLF